MALTDKDMLDMVCKEYAGQGMDIILKMAERAIKWNDDFENRRQQYIDIDIVNQQKELPQGNNGIEKKAYDKSDLTKDPKTATTDDNIVCCLCGKAFKTLNIHLKTVHGIDAHDYRKLCGYEDDKKLMSNKHYEESKQRARDAQAAKMNKEQQPEAPSESN